MRNILISIKPQWVRKILNGEKTIEIRKTIPKCELPCKVYIYCTKSRNDACIVNQKDTFIYRTTNIDCVHLLGNGYIGNGKVVAEFTLKEIEPIHYIKDNNCVEAWYFESDDYIATTLSLSNYELLKQSCLTEEELWEYGEEKELYAWHIDDLKIYDTSKELSDFGLKRTFQSWGYINGKNN